MWPRLCLGFTGSVCALLGQLVLSQEFWPESVTGRHHLELTSAGPSIPGHTHMSSHPPSHTDKSSITSQSCHTEAKCSSHRHPTRPGLTPAPAAALTLLFCLSFRPGVVQAGPSLLSPHPASSPVFQTNIMSFYMKSQHAGGRSTEEALGLRGEGQAEFACRSKCYPRVWVLVSWYKGI